ncbi:MAG: HEPN domain-containing protein [Myxococcota bacterium]
MSVEESIEYWLRLAAYDLDTARALFAAGRHLHTAFFCQQAIEKLFKAVIVRRTDSAPPRIHDLIRLAAAASLHPSDAHRASIERLTPLAMLARYPSTQEPEKAVDRAIAERLLSETEDLDRWLRSIAT